MYSGRWRHPAAWRRRPARIPSVARIVTPWSSEARSGALREPAVDAADVEERRHGVDRPAAADDRLVVQLVGETDPRLEVIGVEVVGAAVLVGEKEQPAADAEGAGRNLRNRVGGIRGLCRRGDVQRRVRVEAAGIAVRPLRRCAFVFPAQPEVDGQLVVDPPVVLNEHAAVDHLVETVGAAVDRAARRIAEQHRREILSDRRRGRVVELTRQDAAAAEGVLPGRVHARKRLLAIDTEV